MRIYVIIVDYMSHIHTRVAMSMSAGSMFPGLPAELPPRGGGELQEPRLGAGVEQVRRPDARGGAPRDPIARPSAKPRP